MLGDNGDDRDETEIKEGEGIAAAVHDIPTGENDD